MGQQEMTQDDDMPQMEVLRSPNGSSPGGTPLVHWTAGAPGAHYPAALEGSRQETDSSFWTYFSLSLWMTFTEELNAILRGLRTTVLALGC